MTAEIGPEIETIVWDLDDTLIDSFGVFRDVMADILPPLGLPMPEEEVMRHNFHGSLEDSIHNCLGGNLDDAKLVEVVSGFLTVQNTHYEVIEHHIFADALHVAGAAHERGIQQIIVTNRAHVGRLNASPRYIVENSSLKPFITHIVCGDDSEHRKPKPEALEKQLADGTVKPETTLVIGDQFVDGEFARNLGARAILVCRNGDTLTHLDRLGDNWQAHINIVPSLENVTVS